MTDYSTLTDKQINLEVARRLGWKHRPDSEYDVFYVTPSESIVSILDYAWSTDLNAAAALDFGDAIISIVIRRETVEIEVMLANGDTLRTDYARERLARAISEAWLLYRDAVGTVGEGAK